MSFASTVDSPSPAVKIVHEQLDFMRSPTSALVEISKNPRQALVGLKHVLVIAVLYDIAILLWALGGASVTMPAFLKIPEEQYYLYEVAFWIPVFLCTWLLASSVAYLLSKILGGKGSFDSVLAGFGLTMAVSSYFTLIPDYVQGILWTTGWVPFARYQEITGKGILLAIVWAYMLAWLLAHVMLYSLTVRQTQRLGTAKSLFVAVVSFATSFAVWITYQR